MSLKVLVTGYPRGATRWAYRVLKSVGCDVGFCSVFTEELNSHYAYKAIEDASHEFEVSWFSAPFLHHPALSDVKIVRLERHPLAVVSSLLWLGICNDAHNTYMEMWHRVVISHAKELNGQYRGCVGQSTLYLVCEWAEKVLQLSVNEDTCVKAEDGAKALLAACGESTRLNKKEIAPCNVSGCVQMSHESLSEHAIGKRMMSLLVERGYNSSGWDATESSGGYCTQQNSHLHSH